MDTLFNIPEKRKSINHDRDNRGRFSSKMNALSSELTREKKHSKLLSIQLETNWTNYKIWAEKKEKKIKELEQKIKELEQKYESNNH